MIGQPKGRSLLVMYMVPKSLGSDYNLDIRNFISISIKFETINSFTAVQWVHLMPYLTLLLQGVVMGILELLQLMPQLTFGFRWFN